jgi:glycine/D-amino acid oxidase-like deaminating enzyme
MYDVIVVGGGIVGATTAYLCAREGLRTLLLDRADEGRATDAGAGIIAPGTSMRHEAAFELGLRAGAYYAALLGHLEEDGGGDTGYARCGNLQVAVTEDELGPFTTLLSLLGARRERHGRPAPEDVREITSDDARELFPPLARPLRAIFDRAAARVDGRLLNQALLRAAARGGVAGSRSGDDRLLMDGQRLAGVRARDQAYQAGHVVIAGGAWSKEFGEQLGILIAVEPQRGQIIHLQVRDGSTGEWPVVHAFRDHYIVAWPGGRVVAGATRETGSGFDARLTAGGVREVLAEALRVAPGLSKAGFLEMRVGLRPLSADGLPLLGSVPHLPGAYLATGHGPSGLTLGPYSARLICDLVLGRAPGGDLALLGVDRFQRAAASPARR